jgi:hypothetical protein
MGISSLNYLHFDQTMQIRCENITTRPSGRTGTWGCDSGDSGNFYTFFEGLKKSLFGRMIALSGLIELAPA